MGVVLSLSFFSLGAREQLAATQAKVAKLWWASEYLAGQFMEATREQDSAAAWARSSAALA